jgi:hypothetical protein
MRLADVGVLLSICFVPTCMPTDGGDTKASQPKTAVFQCARAPAPMRAARLLDLLQG